MKIRKITSLTAAMAFILMLLTSIILFIVPQGRVAYWADWHLWGLSKTDWGNIHINLGLLFLITLGLHVYYNWKPLISYLKSKSKKIKLFTPEFTAALAVTTVFIVGTYAMLPPFSWVMSLNDHLKDAGAVKYGEPPYGHAELSSLQTFARKMDIDLSKSIELLNKAGYAVTDGTMTIQAIAARYDTSPQRIYETIKPAQVTEASRVLPDSPPPGTGNLTLADFSARFNLNLKRIIRELKVQGVDVSAELTLKTIAAQNGISPIELYERITTAALQ